MFASSWMGMRTGLMLSVLSAMFFFRFSSVISAHIPGWKDTTPAELIE